MKASRITLMFGLILTSSVSFAERTTIRGPWRSKTCTVLYNQNPPEDCKIEIGIGDTYGNGMMAINFDPNPVGSGYILHFQVVNGNFTDSTWPVSGTVTDNAVNLTYGTGPLFNRPSPLNHLQISLTSSNTAHVEWVEYLGDHGDRFSYSADMERFHPF